MVSFIRPQVGKNPNLVLVTDETREFTVVNRDASFIDTITDETRDSQDTFDTKF